MDNYIYIYSISKHRKRNTLLNTSQCKRLQQVPEAGSSSAQLAFLKRSGSLCLKPSTKGQTKHLWLEVILDLLALNIINQYWKSLRAVQFDEQSVGCLWLSERNKVSRWVCFFQVLHHCLGLGEHHLRTGKCWRWESSWLQSIWSKLCTGKVSACENQEPYAL